MRRKYIKAITEVFVDEYSQKDYAFLSKISHPIVIEYKKGNVTYNVEIEKLETTDEYVHIIIAVSAGGLSAYMPNSRSFIVYKDGRIEK